MIGCCVTFSFYARKGLTIIQNLQLDSKSINSPIGGKASFLFKFRFHSSLSYLSKNLDEIENYTGKKTFLVSCKIHELRIINSLVAQLLPNTEWSYLSTLRKSLSVSCGVMVGISERWDTWVAAHPIWNITTRGMSMIVKAISLASSHPGHTLKMKGKLAITHRVPTKEMESRNKWF